MDPISIAMGLAQIVPSIVRWIGGDDAGDRADKIVGVARQIAGGADDPADAIKADPAKAMEFRQAMAALELQFYQAETSRLEVVNATMRAESASGSWWQSGWRPFWGFSSGVAFAAQMLGITWLIFFRPAEAPPVIGAVASLTALWGIALTVLGVAVVQRSADKALAMTGERPVGLVSAVADRIKGGGR